MRIISNSTLSAFAKVHPDSNVPLQAWRKIVESRNFVSFSDLKKAFNATDKVATYFVFDVGGNKYRVVAAIHFNKQIMYIRHVFTHKEYDRWKP
ncbi:MAG: type II toxin-antitoxin system HigB family toxin [Pseudomonadota bacterium]